MKKLCLERDKIKGRMKMRKKVEVEEDPYEKEDYRH